MEPTVIGMDWTALPPQDRVEDCEPEVGFFGATGAAAAACPPGAACCRCGDEGAPLSHPLPPQKNTRT